MEDKPSLYGHTSTSSGTWTTVIPDMFPLSVSINGASIKLIADGSYEGNGQAFIDALKVAKQSGTATDVTLWLIANAIARNLDR